MELRRKVLRDMRDNFLQFLAIFLIAALGVFAYSGLNSVRQGLISSMDRYYDEVNMADAWIYVKQATAGEMKAIKEIKHVTDAESRLVYTYTYDNKELELFAIEDNKISTPYLVKGEEFAEDKDGLWIDRDFAESNDYKVGDTIPVNDIDVEIKGIVLSAEKIYAPPTGEAINDFEIFGYAYISADYFKQLFGIYQPSQIVLTADDNSDDVIKNIISEVKDVLKDDYFTYIYGNSQSSINHINERIRQLTQFTYIFPALFYVLALLTMLTTMKRMVDKQKMQIGTMMSLGYSNSRILVHYMSYGIWMGLLGGVIGALTGFLVIPDVLIESFEHLAMVPYWDASFTPGSLLAVVAMVLVCVLAIVISCWKQLKVMPALILRGDTAKLGKHVLLERNKKLWDGFSFERKMIIRNIMRNKVRSSMGVIGVLGSIVLVLAGIGMSNSFDYTVYATYHDYYKYTNRIDIDSQDVKGEDLGLTDKFQYISDLSVEMKSDEKDDAEQYVALLTVADEGDYVLVPDKGKDKNVTDIDGLIISEKFADTLGVSKGDTIYWRYPSSDWGKIKIGLVVNSALPRVAFISRESFEKLDQTFMPTSIFTSMERKEITAKEGVNKIISIDSQEASFQKVCDSSKSIVYILIMAAVLLVVVVLVNLGVLNFTEMHREYATLKVIGLYPREIALLSFKENLILTLVGWIVGLPSAYAFVKVYMKMLSNDTIVCFSKIETSSFVIASAIILVCSLGVNVLLSKKLDTIDMVEALKANE